MKHFAQHTLSAIKQSNEGEQRQSIANAQRQLIEIQKGDLSQEQMAERWALIQFTEFIKHLPSRVETGAKELQPLNNA